MKRPPLNALIACMALAAAEPVWAQDRPAAERQVLVDLAFILGESHALRQVCEGGDDQYWRSRMVRLTEVEKADAALDVQLRERFNAGFARRQDQFPQCDDASRQAEQQAARRGQALAGKLSRSMVIQAPPPQALPDQASPETVADR